MWDAEKDDDSAFEHRLDVVVREIGTRGLMVPETVETFRVPTTVSAPVVTSAPAPAPAPDLAPEQMFSSGVQASTPQSPSQHQQQQALQQATSTVGSSGVHGSYGEMLSLLQEERGRTDAKLEAQRNETEKLRQEIFDLERRLLQQSLTLHEVISVAQVEALLARLAAMHRAQLLIDDELFAIEDMVADFAEARAAFSVVTMEVVAHNAVVGKVHKLLVLNESIPGDAMLVRQLRRKFLQKEP
eukprot:SAG31_NODE_2503_length_5594_cov_1.758326_7_plen_243_part_00